MKKILFLIFLFAHTFVIFGQEHIQFENISLAQAKEKAAKENKLIFLDGYTSWCAPCKWMDRNVFNQKKIAGYFNSNFINTKFDCEAGEGVDIAKQYQIHSFPTYLFLDHKGTMVYRTQSKMDADQFLFEAEKANNPDYQIPNLKSQFKQGNRDAKFLVRYLLVMNNVDQSMAERAKKALDSVANDAFLLSHEGWETIKIMARSNEDKYGRFFENNKSYFKKIANQQDFNQKEMLLLRHAMYSYIRSNQSDKFNEGLKSLEKSKDPETKIETAMLKAEWAGTNGTPQEFITLTNKLRKGILKDEDEKLSFIARRFGSAKMKEFNEENAKQCYLLAKQAVHLNPASYSNQGTLAEICIKLKKKDEAIKAALAARELAEEETSKIQKLADALVERAESI